MNRKQRRRSPCIEYSKRCWCMPVSLSSHFGRSTRAGDFLPVRDTHRQHLPNTWNLEKVEWAKITMKSRLGYLARYHRRCSDWSFVRLFSMRCSRLWNERISSYRHPNETSRRSHPCSMSAFLLTTDSAMTNFFFRSSSFFTITRFCSFSLAFCWKNRRSPWTLEFQFVSDILVDRNLRCKRQKSTIERHYRCK